MRGRPELGPGCPACGDGDWQFDDPGGEFHRDGLPLPEVSAAATCGACGASFYVDLRLPADSIWRATAVPRDRTRLVSFAWLDETLYARGRLRSDPTRHYGVAYDLVAVWEPGGTE